MKNTAIIVFKKELSRFFGDKRLMFTTVLLPGLIIFLMYSVMGEAMNSTMNRKSENEEKEYKIKKIKRK